jgi:hypothetical protein
MRAVFLTRHNLPFAKLEIDRGLSMARRPTKYAEPSWNSCGRGGGPGSELHCRKRGLTREVAFIRKVGYISAQVLAFTRLLPSGEISSWLLRSGLPYQTLRQEAKARK